MPKGYEVYEDPNGKVYARREMKKLITPEEMKIVKDGMDKYCEINDFKLDIKKNIVYIYTVENAWQEFRSPVSLNNQNKYYETNLRFVLVDEETRTFEAERFCYLGSIDDWIELDCSDDLSELVKEYVQHIGKESFYELM